MAKKRKATFKAGDIVILTDGRIFQVQEPIGSDIGLCIRWMDEDSDSYVLESDKFYVKEVISNNPTALLVFLSARSIHLRLNNLSKV